MASEEPLPGTKLVEMVVESVRVHMLSSRHVVILKESGIATSRSGSDRGRRARSR
jgi:hypothetical protein